MRENLIEKAALVWHGRGALRAIVRLSLALHELGSHKGSGQGTDMITSLLF